MFFIQSFQLSPDGLQSLVSLFGISLKGDFQVELLHQGDQLAELSIVRLNLLQSFLIFTEAFRDRDPALVIVTQESLDGPQGMDVVETGGEE